MKSIILSFVAIVLGVAIIALGTALVVSNGICTIGGILAALGLLNIVFGDHSK